MITHHVVHESFKNNISNSIHNIAQGAILFSGGRMPPLVPKCNRGKVIHDSWNKLVFSPWVQSSQSQCDATEHGGAASLNFLLVI